MVGDDVSLGPCNLCRLW